MARLALVTVGITSHLNACLALAEQLREAGHEVLLASSRRKLAMRVEQEGLPFWPLSREGPAGAQAGRAERARERYQASLQGFAIDALVDQWRPDLLLVDSEFHAVILRLLVRDLRPLILEYHIAPRRRAGLPPPTSARLPGEGALNRLRAALEWQSLLLRRRARLVLDRLRAGGRDEPSAWRRIAREGGLPWHDFVRTDHWPILTYSTLTHLYLNAGALQFSGHQDDPAYVGAMVQSSRRETTQPEALEAVRTYLQERDGARPLVACLMGSILSLPQFLREVRDAAQGAAFDVLIAHGTRLTAKDLAPLPSNVRAFAYVPQLEVLRAADGVVCHGGIATLNEAVLAQVPMLVCSGGSLDEHGNAARVVYHGLGRRLELAHATASALRNAIEALLHDAAHGEALQRMAAAYHACQAQRLAVRRIEACLNPKADQKEPPA